MKIHSLLRFVIFSFLVACGLNHEKFSGHYPADDEGAVGGISEVPNPSAKMAQDSNFPLDQLQKGHVIYMLKCGECHAYELPENLDETDWEDVIPDMIEHAGLPEDDEKAVLNYIIAVKKSELP